MYCKKRGKAWELARVLNEMESKLLVSQTGNTPCWLGLRHNKARIVDNKPASNYSLEGSQWQWAASDLDKANCEKRGKCERHGKWMDFDNWFMDADKKWVAANGTAKHGSRT